jgi:hypothetical protein
MEFPFENSAYISQDTGSILAMFRVLWHMPLSQ